MTNRILWFRQDLRLQDNPALQVVAQKGAFKAIYILDEENTADWSMGGASKVWLHHSLKDLNTQLGGALQVYRGNARDIIAQLQPDELYYNRCYEPWRMARDQSIKTMLKERGAQAYSFNGSLLWEPWEVLKKDGSPYRVFTPFYRKGCLAASPPRPVSGRPAQMDVVTESGGVNLNDLQLLDQRPWVDTVSASWDISEAGAHNRLNSFLQKGVYDYKKGRDFPALGTVSRLSPYLHFGQISPHQVWDAIQHLNQSENEVDRNRDHFCSELGWREFSHNLLYYNQDLPHRNLQSRFDAMAWGHDADTLKQWQQGQTGIPLVDAGMRELWQTGYMHNRVRMVVGSFLVKNLLLDWRLGQAWFWDCLFDADLANNSASWQWIAGCGADAAPYFRVFNPILQSQKFDPKGEYIRQYIPEIAHLSDKMIHTPWETPLESATYPTPIVELKESRNRALAAFKDLS